MRLTIISSFFGVLSIPNRVAVDDLVNSANEKFCVIFTVHLSIVHHNMF